MTTFNPLPGVLASVFPTLCGEARSSVALDGETHAVEEAHCEACNDTGYEFCTSCNDSGVNRGGGDCMDCAPPKPCPECAAPRDEEKRHEP